MIEVGKEIVEELGSLLVAEPVLLVAGQHGVRLECGELLKKGMEGGERGREGEGGREWEGRGARREGGKEGGREGGSLNDSADVFNYMYPN